MEINGTKNGEALEVTLSGRLDTNTSPELESYLRENLAGIANLAIDLTDVQYVSSAGLRVFCTRTKSWRKWAAGLCFATLTSTSPMCSRPRVLPKF